VTRTRRDHRRVLERGGQLKRNLDIIRAAHYSVPARQIEALSKDPDVEFISPDRAVFSTATPVYTGNPDYGWRTAGADLATSVFGVDGTGVGIAMIDSGINDSDDLKDAMGHNRIVYKASLIPGQSQDDSYGHGTHVSGILAGNGHKSTGNGFDYLVRGIAPNAHLISLSALDGTGVGTDSAVIAAIQKAISLKHQFNIRVMNLSLGRPMTESYLNDPLCQAVQQAWQAGIVVVVAAGNEGRNNSLGTNGYGTITAPGNSPYVITVGAMNTVGTLTSTDDKIASYSSKGPTSIDHIVKPDLVAPGNRVVSLNHGGSWLQKTYPGNGVAKSVYSTTTDTSAPDYYMLSGTSMAAPMVSGAAALMIQKNPSLTPDQVKARLMKTASKFAPGFSTATDPVTGVTYTSEYDIFTIGAGYLNIPAALGTATRSTEMHCRQPRPTTRSVEISTSDQPAQPQCGVLLQSGVPQQCGERQQCGAHQYLSMGPQRFGAQEPSGGLRRPGARIRLTDLWQFGVRLPSGEQAKSAARPQPSPSSGTTNSGD